MAKLLQNKTSTQADPPLFITDQEVSSSQPPTSPTNALPSTRPPSFPPSRLPSGPPLTPTVEPPPQPPSMTAVISAPPMLYHSTSSPNPPQSVSPPVNTLVSNSNLLSTLSQSDIHGVLRVGDLLSLTLNPYKTQVFNECGTTSWESTWNVWADDEEPFSLSSETGQRIGTAISNSHFWRKKWTPEQLEKELIFVGQCLELWVVRCEVAHDRIMEKPKIELFLGLKMP